MVRPFKRLNAFNLTHTHKLTCNMGYLVPNLCIDVVPGDTMDLTTDIMARMEAMVAPVMHRYDLKYHVFYLTEQAMMPKDFENFITGGKNGDDATVWPHIKSPVGGYLRGSLGDYLGYPCNTLQGDGTGQTNQIDGYYEHSAFPNRMYNKIFNHYFINENLQDELPVSENPGLDETTTVDLQRANWAKSYFTSALDDTERGEPVYVPIGLSAPVIGNGQMGFTNGTNDVYASFQRPGSDVNNGMVGLNNNRTGVGVSGTASTGNVNSHIGLGLSTDPTKSGLITDLQNASGATYHDFRLGNRVNYLQELNKRIGYRIVEWTLGHFGVKVPDDKIYEPVYLGGGSQAIMITPIEQTSETTSTSPQGNLAGRGTTALRSRHIRKTFTQHGWVMGIISIMPKQEYSQGLAKRFQRKTRWDYMLPVMDGAGDDKILNSEIYTQGSNVVDTDGQLVDDKEFGYKPRNEEYRTEPNKVAGELRKGGSMTYWTGGRLFDSLPQLNEDFIKANPSYRIFAVEDESFPHFTVQCIHHLRMLRPLSLNGMPGLV